MAFRRKVRSKFTNRRKSRNLRFDQGARFHVISLLSEGRAVRECARILKCDPKTVRNVRAQHLCPRNEVARSHRTHPETDEKRDFVAKMALETAENGSRRYASAREISISTPFKCSQSTVRRYLKLSRIVSRVRKRIPLPGDGDPDRRRAFCIQENSRILNENPYYLFSDEKIFDTNDKGTRRMWVEKGSSTTPRYFRKWSARVMVWGAVGFNFRKLVFFKPGEMVTAEIYQQKCLPHVVAQSKKVEKMIFIQDGARPHTAKASMKYLFDNEISAPPWPPRSPDLNVIENLWALVEKRIAPDRGSDHKTLQNVVQKAWDDIPTSTINGLVLGFHERLLKCLELRGEFTQ